MVPVYIISIRTVIKDLSKKFIKTIDFEHIMKRIGLPTINHKMIRDENELLQI